MSDTSATELDQDARRCVIHASQLAVAIARHGMRGHTSATLLAACGAPEPEMPMFNAECARLLLAGEAPPALPTCPDCKALLDDALERGQ